MRLRVFGDGQKQPGPVGQGTVVATPEQGTINGPKQAPTATQFGGDAMMLNTQHPLPQNTGWPGNPTRASESPSAGRSYSERTDDELQTQPAPGRILRQFRDRNLGVIADDLMASFPYDAGWGFIPHQYVPRAPRGAGPAVRMVDDLAPVRAVYAGNPRSTQ